MLSADDIKKIRTDRHLTQVQFADRVGVTWNYVSLVETEARPVTYDYVKKIANAFKMRFDITINPKKGV